MQQSSSKKNRLRRVGAGLFLLVVFAAFSTPALARHDTPPPLLIAMAEPPAFLAPAPADKEAEKEEEKEKGAAVTPFIGTGQAFTLLPTPERPAIVASDEIAKERPEVTAGVNVNLGAVKFNLGYTLPSGPVDEFVRPLGVDLAPGPEGKRFSLGVKIPF